MGDFEILNEQENSQENQEFQNEQSHDDLEFQDEIIADFLSLNEIKSFCRVIGDAENDMLKALILSAKSFFESYTQRQLSEFKGDIPDEIKQWARVKIASWYDLRTSQIAGVSISSAENSFIDCVLERWRKSPMRLLNDENELLKAHISAQNELISQMAEQILALKNAGIPKDEITDQTRIPSDETPSDKTEQAEQNSDEKADDEII